MSSHNSPHLTLLFSLASLLILSGCATNWSESQKASLAFVALNKTTLVKNAYQKPDAKVSPGMANSIPAATGGGLIPALIGSAIDASVTAKQQRKFEETNAQYFDALRVAMADAPTRFVDVALQTMLGADTFFGSRLHENSSCMFCSEILNYGLANSPYSKKDDVLLRLRISAKFTIKLADGSILFETTLEGVGSTAKRASEIVADPNFYSTGAREAAISLTDQLQVALDKKAQKS